MDRNEKIWAWASTGTKMHAFVQAGSHGNLRAMCRKNIERATSGTFYGRNDWNNQNVFSVCTRCETLAEAMWDRAEIDEIGAEILAECEAELATEARDLGGEVQERTIEVQGAEPIKARRIERPETLRDAGLQTAEELLAGRRQEAMDFYHAEALEMDVEETAKAERELNPVRVWRYRAQRTTLHGRPLGIVEGYLSAPDAETVERVARATYSDPIRPLAEFTITPL